MQTPGKILGPACVLLAKGVHSNPAPTNYTPPNPKQLESRLQERGQLWQLQARPGLEVSV